MSVREFDTNDVEGTRALGVALARNLSGGTLVLLEGPLGAGKTAFAQGLAAGLGVRGRVPSPTFAIMREYVGGPGRPAFAHIDFYRIFGPSESRDLGVEELLDEDFVLAVEWPERADPIEADRVVRVCLSGDGGRRRIRISGVGPGADPVDGLVTPQGATEH